jgi:hypothetical protein
MLAGRDSGNTDAAATDGFMSQLVHERRLDGAGPHVVSATGAVCMQDVYNKFGQGGDLQCTANDVSLTEASIILSDGCDFSGDAVTFTATYDVVVTANARHDVGIYFSLDGDPNGDGALTGQCTVTTPAYGPSPTWDDLDMSNDDTKNSNDFGYCSPDDGGSQAGADAQCVATLDTALGGGHTCEEFGKGVGVTGNPLQDICGDVNTAANPLQTVITLTVTCVDNDGDGRLDLPYCASWRQPDANELCLTPLAAYPGSPAKCKCDESYSIPIRVPGQIIVDKADPTNDLTSFEFLLKDSVNNLLDTSFSLADANDPYESTGLAAGTYSVTATDDPNYTITATCVSGKNPSKIMDPSAIAVGNGETITCIFTNVLLGVPYLSVEKVYNGLISDPDGSGDVSVGEPWSLPSQRPTLERRT